MQDESALIHKEDEHAASARTRRLLEHLEELLQCPHELTFETLKRIIVNLPEEDRAIGIEALAEHLVSIIKLHFLDIVAMFHQKAEEEGISAAERDEIAHDVRQELFQALQKLSEQLSVKSVNDLATLSNITFGLYTVSHVDNSEQAERWIYKLPRIYRERLEHEHLVVEPPQVTVKISAAPTKSATLWNAALSQSPNDWAWKLQPQELVQFQSWIGKNSHPLVA